MTESILFRFFLSLVCCGLLFAVTGCQNAETEGVSGNSPTDTVSTLIYRYKTNEDFMELCSAKLNEKTVRDVMDEMVSPGWQYFSCEEDPEEFGVSVGENEYLIVFSGGEAEKADGGTIVDMSHKACAVVTRNDRTQNYIINRLFLLDN